MIKNLLLLIVAILISQFSIGQSAINFNCNDCSGTSHNLFSELDSGKVIVMTWVMPCVSCIPVAANASNSVLTFASTFPNRIKFYLIDDYADNTCNTLSSWASSNSIYTDASFSNSTISVADYGGIGSSMQKTVVLGGGVCHEVFYNKNGSTSANSIQLAINNALGPCEGIEGNNQRKINLKLFPNPVENYVEINYELTVSKDLQIEITNALGEKMQSISLGKKPSGADNYKINVESLQSGIYYIRLTTDENSEFAKFLKL